MRFHTRNALQLHTMITVILTLILLHASGVTADNCNNYARKAEYNVFKIKAECGTNKCISSASQARIKAYKDDLHKCNTNIKNLRCKQNHIDLPATPRTCTRCDDLEARIIRDRRTVSNPLYFRKRCITRRDLTKVKTYEKSYETCKDEFSRLRCRQNIGEFPSVPRSCTHAPTPSSSPTQRHRTSSPTSAPTESPTSTPTPSPTDAPTLSPTTVHASSPTDAPTQAPTPSSCLFPHAVIKNNPQVTITCTGSVEDNAILNVTESGQSNFLFNGVAYEPGFYCESDNGQSITNVDFPCPSSGTGF